MPELSLHLLFTAVDRCSGHARARGHRCSIMGSGDTSCADATPPCRAVPRSAWPKYTRSVSSGLPRWWRLGLAITEVVLAAGLIVAAVTEGGWYWWAGAIAAATLALSTCPCTCVPSVRGVDHLIPRFGQTVRGHPSPSGPSLKLRVIVQAMPLVSAGLLSSFLSVRAHDCFVPNSAWTGSMRLVEALPGTAGLSRT